jgi:hypothetical protein
MTEMMDNGAFSWRMVQGGGGGQASYPASVLAGLWGGTNQAFQPLPYPGVKDAASSTLSGINTLGQGAAPPNIAGSTGLGNQLTQAGSSALPLATQPYNTMAPYASQALQTAFDPQQALYAKMFQQQQDQNNASLSQSGVATTPYGAGLMQQGNQNFDIAWQQAQLANQSQGANTASTLFGSGVSGLSGILGAAGGAGQTGQNLQTAPQQQVIQDLLNYLGANTANSAAWANATNQNMGATNQMYNTQANQQIAQNQQTAQGLGGLGSLVGQLGGAALNLA